uniref:DUF6818 domain-containing protein n=1 Tax=Phytophthora ramorum TaxID=164328 RepID=H3H5P4_PHYRM
MRTSSLCVVAAEPIRPGEVLSQYLGEMEHVRASVRDRPRNRGYRLVMKTRPEFAASSFREDSIGRRTTVVVATTDFIRQGQEITIEYGDDLWFICRCQDDLCRHREMQDQDGPERLRPLSTLAARFGANASSSNHDRIRKHMVKPSGSPNYKMAEITRLLKLVEEHLPLGKDEWGRVTMAYNKNRSRTWAERDLDSLRRKFKALYSVRKPTGTAEMPPHIEKANNSSLGSSAFEMMLLFREENERKAEVRRVEEDLRRRDEAAAKEVRLIADKVEMEERRRQDKMDMDERLRRNKEDTPAGTQELLLLIGAVMKKN